MPRQRHRRLVGDRELIAITAGMPRRMRALRDPAEGVTARSGGAHAAVEEDQSQRGQVIAQQHRELAAGNAVGAAWCGVRFEHQYTFVANEIAMADEVQDVGPGLEQRVVEALERGVVGAHGLGHAAVGQFGKRAVEVGDLLADLQVGPVAGAANAISRRSGGSTFGVGGGSSTIKPAHHRLHAVGKKVIPFRAVEEFPGQAGEVGERRWC